MTYFLKASLSLIRQSSLAFQNCTENRNQKEKEKKKKKHVCQFQWYFSLTSSPLIIYTYLCIYVFHSYGKYLKTDY